MLQKIRRNELDGIGRPLPLHNFEGRGKDGENGGVEVLTHREGAQLVWSEMGGTVRPMQRKDREKTAKY